MSEQSSDFNQKLDQLQQLQNELSKLAEKRSELLRKVMVGEVNRSRETAKTAKECFQHGQERRAHALLDHSIQLLQKHIANLNSK